MFQAEELIRAKVLSGKKMFKVQQRGQCEWSRFIKENVRKGWINTQKPDPVFQGGQSTILRIEETLTE